MMSVEQTPEHITGTDRNGREHTIARRDIFLGDPC